MKAPRISYYLINAVTLYRLASAPFLLLLAVMGKQEWFRWLIAFSFFTDAIDGPLSRKYKVGSVFGSRLDSVADDATVLVSIIALWILHPEFFEHNLFIILCLLALFGIQTVAALVAYKKVTSFHTYLAKTAAVVQAVFFIFTFFNFGFRQELFLVAAVITGIQLMEEIALVIVLPEWKANVKGLYWVWRSRERVIHSK
jgi:CDP-diacylglycerol--glycerol-3-phosphate 3-phosphatidyltransferase